MRKTGIFILILFIGILNQQCLKTNDYQKQEQEDISSFLKANNITAEPTESGLYYVVDSVGTGLQPVTNDTVSINYITYNLNGQVIDSNIKEVGDQQGWGNTRSYEPFTFVLGSNQVIQGLNEGVSYMKEGGTALLVIPSKLAYNDYRPLAIYVDLLEVKHDTTSVK